MCGAAGENPLVVGGAPNNSAVVVVKMNSRDMMVNVNENSSASRLILALLEWWVMIRTIEVKKDMSGCNRYTSKGGWMYGWVDRR